MRPKAYTTSIPGIPGGPVKTIAPVKFLLIPEWRTLNRPGTIARSPRRSVQHGTGNPNSTAASEARYLYNGAEGRQASYHSTTDDKETYVMVPGNEVTWQAADGGGPGNMNGFSNEMAESSSVWSDSRRRMLIIENTADFMGTISARLHIAKPEQHWDFNYRQPSSDRHNCPDKLRTVSINGKSAWSIYVGLWNRARTEESARMRGEPVTVPEKTPPSVPYPRGMDGELLSALFGRVTGSDGKSYKFDPNGSVSKLWLDAGMDVGMFPKLVDMRIKGEAKYFIFSNGLVLWHPKLTARISILGEPE